MTELSTPLMLALSGESLHINQLDRFQGVGMIRGEYVMRSSGHYVRSTYGRDWLRAYLSKTAAMFAPRPVWYRLSDFEPREISTLFGADTALPTENPLMAARGLRRGILFPETFEREIEVLSEVSENNSNLHLLFSFVGTEEELIQGIKIAKDKGFSNELGTMIETPSAAYEAASLALHVNRFVVGLNDLTSFFFAAERGSTFARKDHLLIRDLLLNIKAIARANGVQVALAGDIDASLLTWLDQLVFDTLIVHYSTLPKVLGPEFASLPDIDLVPRLKREMSASLRAMPSFQL